MNADGYYRERSFRLGYQTGLAAALAAVRGGATIEQMTEYLDEVNQWRRFRREKLPKIPTSCASSPAPGRSQAARSGALFDGADRKDRGDSELREQATDKVHAATLFEG